MKLLTCCSAGWTTATNLGVASTIGIAFGTISGSSDVLETSTTDVDLSVLAVTSIGQAMPGVTSGLTRALLSGLSAAFVSPDDVLAAEGGALNVPLILAFGESQRVCAAHNRSMPARSMTARSAARKASLRLITSFCVTKQFKICVQES